MTKSRIVILLILFTAALSSVRAQVVHVSAKLDSDTVFVGGTTTLRVFAQIIPEAREDSDRIFSWYVDVLNPQGALASANYAAMQKTASDQDPSTSSTGGNDGPNRRGIYDTFLDLEGAGKNAPVELMAIPVSGLAAGQATFSVQAGTTVPFLSADFIVAPAGGGDPLTGGLYASAAAQLTVVNSIDSIAIVPEIASADLGGGLRRVTITFDPVPGLRHTVQYNDGLSEEGWFPLPGGPHDTGSVTDETSLPRRFYRVQYESDSEPEVVP